MNTKRHVFLAVTASKRSYCLCGDDVFLLALVEPGNAFHSDVVRFGRSACEDDFFGICSNQVCHLLSILKQDGQAIEAFSKSRSHKIWPTVVASLMLIACLVVQIIQR